MIRKSYLYRKMKIAFIVPALALCLASGVPAEEPETEAAETELTSVDVPESRPEYTASDYVTIDNDDYKGITVTVYPPADDSDEAQAAYEEEVDTQIMSRLFGLYQITSIPDDLMAYTAGNLTGTYLQYAQMYGMDFSSFLETYLDMDQETFKAQAETAAEQTLTEEIILKAIAERENITISDEEYEQGCADYAVKYGFDSADTLKQAFDEQTIRVSLLMDKTFDFLENEADIQLIIETETETEGAAETEADTGAAQPQS